MKKVILSLVAACAMTTAFAQNSASLSQSGTGNSSSTTQIGNAQTAVISQNGTGNVNVNEQFSVYGQQVNVTQTGLTNSAFTFQNDNAGPSNLINITQNGTGSGGNMATVNQSDFWTINALATVVQDGQGNMAEINQLSSLNDIASITQVGSGQVAEINQGNGGAPFSSQSNVAVIEQYSTFGPQYALINQLGVNNDAYVYQNADAGPNNFGTINQTGDNNYALIDQSDFSTISTTGTITQMGNSNVAALYQRDGGPFTSGSEANISQMGDSNTARLQQTGGANNQADITQTGDFNMVQGISGSVAMQIGDNNTLTVTQSSFVGGPGQTANVQQMGSGNTGTITQSN